jgi:hypothetical protein
MRNLLSQPEPGGSACGQDAVVIALLTTSAITVPAVVTAAALLVWARTRARREHRELRAAGWRLIHELKAYSAWIELLHGEPFTTMEPEQLTAAQALRNARSITQASFPELSQAMLRLLQADSRLMGYLWEQKLLRIADPAAWVPYERDRAYWELRDTQEDLIEEMIVRCQVLMGEHNRSWRATDLTSEFFSTQGLSTR